MKHKNIILIVVVVILAAITNKMLGNPIGQILSIVGSVIWLAIGIVALIVLYNYAKKNNWFQ